MNTIKSVGLLLGLFFWSGIGFVLYRNSDLYYGSLNRHEKIKIARLEAGTRYFPLNDLAFYELGKAYFNLGLKNLNDARLSEEYFQKAVLNLRKSIRINPASSFSHFYLGQTLLYRDLISPQKDCEFEPEFRKAVQLAGENIQILTEAGALFLSHWSNLSEGEQRTTLGLLNRIIAKTNRDDFSRFLSIWEMNIKDYSVMEQILPENAQLYRQYAEYLGEKSLSLEERIKYLAKAEQLEFDKARDDCQRGESLLSRYQIQSALRFLDSALNLLKGIRLYQALSSIELIGSREYEDLTKETLLALIKARIEDKNGQDGALVLLSEYLSLEDRILKVAELETYLRDRKILPAKLGGGFNDLSRLALELRLLFGQSRYREIANFGRHIAESLVVVPTDKIDSYINILLLIGDSHQKIDFLYEAGDFYQKAFELSPGNLEVLLRLRHNYVRLNADRKLSEVDKTIENIIEADCLESANRVIEKGEIYLRSLASDGRRIALKLHIRRSKTARKPLLAVFFNNRIIWEDYLNEDVISLVLDARPGENELQIVPVNRPVVLADIKYTWNNQDEGDPVWRRRN